MGEETAKDKGLTIVIKPEEIVGSEIARSGDYKYASVGIKKGDGEYMRISYEWKDEGNIPEFVMGLMKWISSNKDVIEENKEEKDAEYASMKKGR